VPPGWLPTALALSAFWLAPRWAGAAPAVQMVASDVDCPSAEDLRRSLAARLHGGPVEGSPLSVRLQSRGDGSLRLQLTTATGQTLLTRDLERAGGSCVALAETAAIMVDRCLREIAYRAPPPEPTRAQTEPPTDSPARAPSVIAAPPPSPAPTERPVISATASPPMSSSRAQALVGVGLGSRSGLGTGGGQTRPEVRLVVGLERRWLALWAEAGLAGGNNVTVLGSPSDVALRVHPYPVRLLAGVVLGGSALALMPLVGATVDLLRAEAATATASAHSWRIEPGAEAGAALRWAMSPLLWVRGSVLAGATLQPRDYLVAQGANSPAFRTPGAFVRVSVEAGFTVGKK
jgi:hypothetical protein